MKQLNFEALMSAAPTLLHEFTNFKGQHVRFFEHPTLGDSYPVIVVIGKVAVRSEFYDVDDMAAEGEYAPILLPNNKIVLNYECSLTELP